MSNFRTIRSAILWPLWLEIGICLEAAEVLRGPYLQIATPDSITIRWRTDVFSESIVYYGTQSNELDLISGNLFTTTEHEVRVAGLTPDTKYFYAIGSLSQILATGPDYQFITHPLPGTPKSTRIWVVGDPGQSADDNQINVRDAYYSYADSRHTDIWITLGDNAYYAGTDEEYQTNFFEVYEALFRRTAIWPTIGNHDTYSVEPSERIPYLDIFSCPTNGEAGGVASGVEEYYAFDYGDVHFISLDSTTTIPFPDGPMVNWLRADLEANTNRWVIAFWHHPPYSKGYHDSDTEIESIEMRQYVVPIIEEYGVDLVLCGHNHDYERTFLLHGHYGFSSTLEPEMIMDEGDGREGGTGAYIKTISGPQANRGTVYLAAGCAGYVWPPEGHHPAVYVDEARLGSVVLDINSNRLDAVFLRDTGSVDDRFTIIKGAPDPLRICTFHLASGTLVLRWKSLAGHSYQIEQATRLNAEDWQPETGLITATGATTSWTNSAAPQVGQVFYRITEAAP